MPAHLLDQGPQPMPLALSAKTGGPAAILDPMGKATQDGGNRGLETGPMGKRAETEGELTIRAAITAKEKRLFAKLIKIGCDKAVPPDPPPAARTVGRTGPRELSLPFENLLDADIHME